MSSNLYNISNELLELRDQLETENEFADESPEREWIENNLEIKEDELDTKLEGCIHVINQAEAQAAGALKEIARIQKFVIKKQHIAERIQGSLLQALLLFGKESATGVKKLEFGTNTLSTRRSTSVNILDEGAVTDDCKSYDVTFKDLTPEIKRFVANRIQDLPESTGKAALLRAYGAKVKISKALVKNKLEEDDLSWAETVTKYSLTIK
jgi:hypothetical protein